jgi:hypothetical protein
MKSSFIDNDASVPLQSQSVFHRYQIIHANALALKGFALISPQMQRSVSLWRFAMRKAAGLRFNHTRLWVTKNLISFLWLQKK